MSADLFSLFIQHFSSFSLDVMFQKLFYIDFTDKTKSLAVFSIGIWKFKFLGQPSDFWFRNISHRKKHMLQIILVKCPQKITLVFIFIVPFEKLVFVSCILLTCRSFSEGGCLVFFMIH